MRRLVTALLLTFLLAAGARAQPAPLETLGFASVADSYVDAGTPSANLNGSKVLLAGSSPTRIAYLRFAVTGVNGRTVLQARLRLAVARASADSSGTVHAISDGTWSETALTWANHPPVDGAAIATVGPVPTVGAVVEFVLDGAVRGDGVYNLAIDSASTQTVGYVSAAGSGQKPTLVLGVATGPAPTVHIVQPPNGAGFFEGDKVTLQGTATDAADGDLGAAITWRSSLQGFLGTGKTLVTPLARGAHTLTASVTDQDGFKGSDRVSVTVSPRPPANTAPLVVITGPIDGTVSFGGQPLGFAGSANDIEDGLLTPRLSWTSDLDGTLGAGGAFTRTLSEGQHKITARVTDAGGLAGAASVKVTVVPPNAFQFAPDADAYVDAAAPKANFGSTSLLRAVSSSTRLAYLRFTVSGVGRQAVTQAVVRLQVDSSSAAASDSGGSLYAIPGAVWKESTITYETAPPVGGSPVASAGAAGAGQTIDFDVTGAIVGDGVYDFALVTTSADEVAYRSRESKTGPQLALTVAGGPPTVTVTAPATGSVFVSGTPITLTATATDAEDGDLTGHIRWTSSLDGSLGTGGRIGPRTLKVGFHTITASVTDLDGRTAQSQITFRVRAPNAPPKVTITAPASGGSSPAGTPVTLTATALDDFDGDLSARIQWSSSREGPLGVGASRTVVLREGTHTLTATVIDSDGAIGTAQVTRTITPSAPTVTITAPTAGKPIFSGAPATFAATAMDPTDGNLSPLVAWTSDRDGALGTGATISVGALSLGPHTITASVQDASGLGAEARLDVLVRPPNVPPVLTLESPLDGSGALAGRPLLLAAQARDAEDGDLGASVRWTSSRNGNLGTGSILTVTKLSLGTHTITATVADRDGATATRTASVVVSAATLVFPAVADTYVDASTPTKAYGRASGLFASGTPVRSLLTRFAVRGLGTFRVQQALLRLTVGTSGSDGSNVGGVVQALPPGTGWTEPTTTWATRPPLDGAALAARTTKVSAKQAIDFDVTAALHGDGDYDFGLTSSSSDPVRYQSRETSNGPKLTVTLVQDTTPIVRITSPAGGSKLLPGPVTFTGRALDAESGDLSAKIAWRSSLDGPLGTGASITAPALSPGTHTISATVTEPDGRIGHAEITVRMRGPNQPPSISVTAPADRASAPAGSTVTLSATVTDEWDDDLSARIQWSSSRDGALGGGPMRTAVLSEGDHVLTATVTDLDGATGTASVRMRITPTPPVVTIISPPVGLVVTLGTPLTFSGGALDATDGDLSSGLAWSSDRDGALGSGARLDVAMLTVGPHTITATATDAGGLVGKATRTLIVNAPPAVTVATPGDGRPLLAGKPFRLVGTASDPEEGDISARLRWSSDRDGPLGAGAAVIVAGLSAGTHVLTATVQDNSGATASASVTVAVAASTLTFAPLADTYVDAGNAAARFGTAPELLVGAGPTRVALLRFPVAGVAPFVVDRAVLRLTAGKGSADGGKVGTTVSALTDTGWSEGITTWTTRPALPTTTLGVGPAVQPGQTVEIDVTPAVRADGGVELALTSASSDWIRYISREGGSGAPQLVVSLRPRAPAVTILEPVVGASVLAHTPLALFATAVDPDEGDVATGITWTSDLDGALGTGGSLTVAALSPGLHTVTANAPNSHGLVGTAQVQLNVLVDGLVFPPVADTYVDQLLPTTNFGTALGINVVGLPSLQVGLLRFDVTGISGRLLQDARVELTVRNLNTASGGVGGTLRAVPSSSWSELTTTFANAPKLSGSTLDAVTLPVVQGQVVPFHVGALVTKDGSYGFALTSPAADGVKYESRENTHPPRLVVQFRPPASTLPVVRITAPATSSAAVFDDQTVTLAGTATDPKDGTITSTLVWRSSLDGVLGTGGTVKSVRLSRGTHVITATARNKAGASRVAAVTISVNDRPPALAILAPAPDSVLPASLPATFTGTATDDLDGDLSAQITWTSDRDGVLGTGATITAGPLAIGDHVITATVVNSLGTTATTTVAMAIGNAGPHLTVLTPTTALTIPEGTTLPLQATATDREDGGLDGRITWTSSLQGALGTGPSLAPLMSAIGTHQITATVADSGGLTKTFTVPVTVTLAPPVLTVLSPSDGSSFTGAVTFSGKAIDFRDGDRSSGIRWRSSISGTLGRGPSLTVKTLPFGRHVITAEVADSNGLVARQTFAIAIGNVPPTVIINAPAPGTSVPVWTPLSFAAVATDVPDGDLTAGIQWSSDLSGPLGSGPSITIATLPRGTHTITARAADGQGLTGSASITVTVTGGPRSRPPRVTIAQPAGGSELPSDAPVTFTGSAFAAAGDIGTRLAWISSLDGLLGTGPTVTTHLSPGLHHITASAPETDGTLGMASVDVTVAEQPLVFAATADAYTDELTPTTPLGAARVLELDAQPIQRVYLRFGVTGLPALPVRRAVVRLTTTTATSAASDVGGDLFAVSAPWDEATVTHATRPPLDGTPIASVAAVAPGQPVDFDVTDAFTGAGDYAFGLRSSSLNGAEYVAREADAGGPQLIVFLAEPAADRPTVRITAPGDGAMLAGPKAIALAATASDPQDGDLGAAVVWRSDRDGALGTGRAIAKALSPGVHTITATVVDHDGNVARDLVRIVVTAANSGPVVAIAAPASGGTVPLGTPLSFIGTAFDLQDGDLSFSLRWTSNVDGALGTGPSFTRALSAGTHTITATVTDTAKKTGTATVRLTVAVTRLGTEDFGFGPNIETALDKATATKPQSKLWVQDGIWWACLFVAAKSEVHIHRLDLPTQTWIDTGVLVDDRGKSRADTLVVGNTLYVASRFGFTGSPPQNRLLRYTYHPDAETYTLDPGFPVNIPGGGAEALTVARDSLGTVWITYALNGLVFVAHTRAGDTDWTAPFQPPVQAAATTATIDDDSAVVALKNGKIGVFWSNQVPHRFYFAVHTDGAPDLDPAAWKLETASALPNVADDHFNLKLAADGRLFVAVKTSINTGGQPTIGLLVRSPTGVWSPLYPITNWEFGPTRPICLLDESAHKVYVAYSSFMSDIYYKASDMNAIAFKQTGVGTPLLVSGTSPTATGGLNDPTSAKELTDPAAGILVLASTSETNRYWHGWIRLPSWH